MHNQRKDPKIAKLRALPALSACSEKDLETFAKLGDEIMVPPGERILREGIMGRQAFFILEGRASVTAGGAVVGTIGPGEFAGEWSLVRHEPRAATVTADTRMTILALDPRSFDALNLHPTLRHLVDVAVERNERGPQRVVGNA